MTREERNNKLKHLITCMKCEVSGKCCDENCPTQYDAGNMGEIIKNLEEISKILEQEPCMDVISRAETINAMTHWFSDMLETGKEKYSIDDVLNSLSPVTPAPKKCHNVNSDYAECDQFVCSNCGIELQDWHRVERDEDDGDVTYHQYEFKYCPNCGSFIMKEV